MAQPATNLVSNTPVNSGAKLHEVSTVGATPHDVVLRRSRTHTQHQQPAQAEGDELAVHVKDGADGAADEADGEEDRHHPYQEEHRAYVACHQRARPDGTPRADAVDEPPEECAADARGSVGGARAEPVEQKGDGVPGCGLGGGTSASLRRLPRLAGADELADRPYGMPGGRTGPAVEQPRPRAAAMLEATAASTG